MAQPATIEPFVFAHLDRAIADLQATKDAWARTGVKERLTLLEEIKDATMSVAESWATTAARKKQIPPGSPLAGEEWMSGPYALLSGCNAFIQTLSQLEGKALLRGLPLRDLPTGQIAAKVVPNSLWDRLLLSGVTAEVWMQPGVTRANLADNVAGSYDIPAEKRVGKVALVLGAGNIAAIAPLDCFHKLFVEHQATILKLNPVNDYLIDVLQVALRPLIARGVLRIVRGGADVGRYLCEHPGVDEIHITGAEASHDAIVWGPGDEGRRNKERGQPRNARRITSELGAVCPTLVVPGPWSDADIAFQAEHIATQKLHNDGFNCIACQILVVSEGWDATASLLRRVEETLKAAPPRAPYYPGAERRMDDFASHGRDAEKLERAGGEACVVVCVDEGDAWLETNEVFAPAMGVRRLDETNPEAFLRAAIRYANERLHGTLGANILIHPATIHEIGETKFDAILAELRYGCIAINAWSGLGFLLVRTPWGAFPGHRLDDVQSGIGFVHNTFLFDKPERTVVRAPFRPYPRSLLGGDFTLLPRPPWFVTNRKQDVIGRLLTSFEYKPSWLKIPRIFANALLG
jgi:acyl-CoA reductase-like NAD-dependent aldehyde dehydrogenase